MPGIRRPLTHRALRELVQLRLRGGLADNASFDEAVHRSHEYSRRDVLRTAGLAGAGLALAACTSGEGAAPSSSQPAAGVDFGNGPRIIIIGAGLAGLTVAYRLHQAGIASQVYEARDRVGGRCWSSTDWVGGVVGEHGGEFIDTRHVHLRGLAQELHLPLEDLWSDWDPSATSVTWVDDANVNSKQLMAPLLEASKALTQLAKANGSYLAGEATPKAIAFDRMTQKEWFEKATGESVNSPMGRLMNCEQSGWYGLDADDLGASNFIDYFAVDWPHGDERYTTRGGNDQIPQRLADALPAGTVILETPLESIRKTSSNTYELGFTGSSETVVADHLVLALPYTILRELDIADAGFSKSKLAGINQLGMGTGSKVLLEFDQPFDSFNNWSGWATRADDPQFQVWESGGADVKDESYALLTVFGGGKAGAKYPTKEAHGQAPASVAHDTIAALEEMLPGTAAAHTGQVWLDYWTIDPWVKGSYAAFLPTQTTSFYGILGDAEGNAHFAGEHTSIYSQGFLNGGAESGSRVAAEILDALDKPYPPGLTKAFKEQKQYEPVFPWQ